MKLTDLAIEVLSNFSTINAGIVINAGNVIKTISPGRHVLAEATLDVDFPNAFAVHDLKRLLNVVSLFDKPDLNFEDQYLTINDKNSSTRYLYSPAKHIQGYSEKGGYPTVELLSEDIKFELSEENLAAVLRASAVLQMPNIAVRGDKGEQKLVVCKADDPTSDTYERDLGNTTHTFTMIYTKEDWKFLPRTYQVAISSKGLACFAAKDIRYWIAAESNSNFEG